MEDRVYHIAKIFKALSDPTRLKIIRFVATKKENFYVGEIAEKLNISSSAVSQHLKILQNVNIVRPVRKGYKMYYELNKDNVDSFKDNMEMLLKMVFVPCDFDGPCDECLKKGNCTVR